MWRFQLNQSESEWPYQAASAFTTASASQPSRRRLHGIGRHAMLPRR